MTRLAPFLLFLTVALAIIFGMHYYAWARLVRDPQLPLGLSRVLGLVLALLAVSLVAAPVLARMVRGDALRPLFFAAFFWMGAGFLLVALLGLADAGRAVGSFAVWILARLGAVESGPADPSRRLFLARAIAATAGVGAAALSVAGVRAALASLEVRRVRVTLAKLPAALSGLRVVQISDVHIGQLLRKEWLQGVVEKIQALAPDLVAITGDLVDGSVRELAEHVAPLARLKARHGVFFVTGNHEYYSGAPEWLAHLPSLGVRPLSNERVRIADGFELAGVTDWSADPDLDRALQGRDSASALVLLAHQPKQFLDAAKKGVDLTLSGHTHGGQIFPFNFIVKLVQPYVAGLHRLGSSQLYVSRGTGFWGPPLRVLAPAEITLLELHPAA